MDATIRLFRDRDGGRLWVTPAAEEFFVRLPEVSVRAVLDLRGGFVVSSGTRRTVRRLELPGGHVAYLKTSDNGGTRSVVRSMLRQGRRRAALVQEFDLLSKLRELGIGAAEPLAAGEVIRGIKERGAFLVTRAVPGVELERAVAESLPGSQGRLNLMRDLRDYVLSLHQKAIYPHEFAAKHLLWSDGCGFRLIDVQNAERPRRPDTGCLIRMLARAAVQMSPGIFTRAEIREFVQFMAPQDSISFRRKVLTQMHRELKSRRHRRSFGVGRRKVPPIQWIRSNRERLLVDPAFAHQLEAGGLSVENANGAAWGLEQIQKGHGFDVYHCDQLAVRRVFNLYNGLYGRRPVLPLAAVFISAQGGAVVFPKVESLVKETAPPDFEDLSLFENLRLLGYSVEGPKDEFLVLFEGRPCLRLLPRLNATRLRSK